MLEHLGGAGVHPREPPHAEAAQGGHRPAVGHHVAASPGAGVKLLLQHQREVAPEQQHGEAGQELDEEQVPQVGPVHGLEGLQQHGEAGQELDEEQVPQVGPVHGLEGLQQLPGAEGNLLAG